MSFKQGKTIMTVMLVLAGLICILALFTFEEGSSYATYAIIAAVVLVLLSFGVCWAWCRCPYCQARIVRNVLKLKACPYCGRDFESGKKVQKVKK